MDLKDFAIDPAKETSGVWMNYDEKSKFLIGAMNTDAYVRRVRELLEPLVKNLARGDKLDPALHDACVVKAMSELILLGWEGVEINGQALAYSQEAARAALAAPQLRPFREWISQRAVDIERFQLENFEDLMGNLLRSSATTVQ